VGTVAVSTLARRKAGRFVVSSRIIRYDEILDMISFLLNSPESLTGSIIEISGGA
jgi:hypothetical protein